MFVYPGFGLVVLSKFSMNVYCLKIQLILQLIFNRFKLWRLFLNISCEKASLQLEGGSILL